MCKSAYLGSLVLVLPLGCHRAEAYVKPPVPVRVSAVRAEPPATGELRFSGTVVPEAEIGLSFKVGGYATSLLRLRDATGILRPVQAGDRVRRGTVLARVRQEDYRQAVAEARGALEAARALAAQARLDHERAARLIASRTIPQAEYDAVKARTDGADAAVDAASARLANAEIAFQDAALRAPVDALVLSRSVELGNLVAPGQVAFRLADVSRIKALFAVPDGVARRLVIGSRLGVTSDALEGRTIAAVVSKIVPQSDSVTRTFDVEATLASPRSALLLGMVVSIALPEQGAVPKPVTAPLTALVVAPPVEGTPAGLRAFVVEDDRGVRVARERTVVAGGLAGNEVAIESGLAPGDRLVVQGAALLTDGEPVQIVP